MTPQPTPADLLAALRAGDATRARTLFESLAPRAQDSALGLHLRGMCDLVAGRPADALTWLRRAAGAAGGQDADIGRNLTAALKGTACGRPAADAAPLYEEALALDPGDADALYGLASCRLALGDLAEAETLLRALVGEAGDGPAEALLALGTCLLEQGRVDAAHGLLARLVARDPATRPAVATAMTTARAGRLSMRAFGADGLSAPS